MASVVLGKAIVPIILIIILTIIFIVLFVSGRRKGNYSGLIKFGWAVLIIFVVIIFFAVIGPLILISAL
jgi:hypothetical protein